MKINWGTGIVIAIVAFMAFIIFMVVKMTTNHQYDHDLVVDDYYKKELKYQSEIDKINNLKQFKTAIIVSTLGENIVITFPKEIKINQCKGVVNFYRPSNKNLDFKVDLNLKSHQWIFPKKNLIGGRWNLSIDFTLQEISYLFKEEIIL